MEVKIHPELDTEVVACIVAFVRSVDDKCNVAAWDLHSNRTHPGITPLGSPHRQGAYLSDNVADAAQVSEDVVLDDITNVSGPHQLLSLRLPLLLLLLLLIVKLFKLVIMQS